MRRSSRLLPNAFKRLFNNCYDEFSKDSSGFCHHHCHSLEKNEVECQMQMHLIWMGFILTRAICVALASITIHFYPSTGAKLVIMVRDPADAVFSGEIMLSNMGVNLGWTLTDPVNDERNDPRFKASRSHTRRQPPLPHSLLLY